MLAAERFFKKALQTTGLIQSHITTDKETALYPGIKNILPKTKNRVGRYINNKKE